MMNNNTLAEFCIRINNAHEKNYLTVSVINTKINKQVAKILYKEGFIRGYQILSEKSKTFNIFLKYKQQKRVIKKFIKISQISKKVSFSKKKFIHQTPKHFSILILSTSKGILSNIEAKKLKVGGELLCEVF